MTIKLFDVTLENSWIREAFFDRLATLYDSANFTLGYGRGPVEEIEEALSSHCGRRHALAVGAGTHALHMAAHALRLGPGDEVIVPANTFISTATAAAMVGATVVPCDVDPETLNVTRATVEAVLSPRTRAIFAVNLYGNPAPYRELSSIGIPIVEDAAHSHGAVLGGRPSGSFGAYSVFSFFPTKVLGGVGDSGMILFDDPGVLDELRAFRNVGQAAPHYATVLGNAYRMHVLQAAFLLEKWAVFARILEHRRAIATVYDECFRGTSVRPQLVTPGATSSYFAYVVRVGRRAEVGERLKAMGIPWTVQYRYLLHEQPVWGKMPTRAMPVPDAERVAREILSIPMNTSVTEEQAREVADALLKAVKEV